MPVRSIEIGDAALEVRDWGAGESVLFVQTAVTADHLLPLASQPALEDSYRKIVYHRRGYAGSSSADGPGSVVRDAADARALLAAMVIARAHVVGVSYSAAVALQLAADAPESVQSLTLLEPPPLQTAHGPEFREVNERLLRTRREQGVDAALEEFLTMVIAPDWRDVVEDLLPGAAAQIERDAATILDTDLPALLAWRFGPSEAERITCPTLYVGGTDSGPWFAAVRDLVLEWLPHASEIVIDGADHSLAVTHPSEIADALVAFFRSHPLDARSTR